MESLRFELIKDLATAQTWWETFVPREYVYDDWEFRYCFYKYAPFELFFYVGYEKDQPVGLLPLQYNIEKDYLEFFGGSYMSDNQVYCKSGYEHYRPQFYQALKEQKVKLQYITGTDPFTSSLPLQINKYILNLEKFTSFDDYLQFSLDGDARGKLRRKIKKIEQHRVTTRLNTFEDIELLFDYNIQHFGASSSFNFPHTKERFRNILQLSYPIFLYTFFVDEIIQGISFGLDYRGVFEYLNIGVQADSPKELRAYINYYNIQEAIKRNIRVFDASVGDCGWKEHWHFTKIPQHIFERHV